MTEEDLQNRIEQVAYDGAITGCNQSVIEREASKLAREIVKLFAIQNVNVRFPSKEKVIEEGERQIDVWLEGNTERELQHFRVGFRRSFEYVLRCLNAR